MPRPFWWFSGDSVRALRERLNAAGDTARLEVHLDGNDMTLDVVPADVIPAAPSPSINESHICPPVCP